MLKLIPLFLASFFIISCNNEKPAEKVKPAVTPPDSGQVAKTSRTNERWTPVDISPMDMTYFPVDFPKLHNNPGGQPLARVIYSRPHLQGRKLFDNILKYGEPWRLGANEATELDLFKPATIQGKMIKEGRYVLYCIPQKDKWTIVLNSHIDSWGLHPDSSSDIARFDVPAITTPDSLEYFTILFRNGENNTAELYMAWDNVEAVLPISF